MYCTYNKKLLDLVIRERNNNCLWRYVDGWYRESEVFKRVCLRFINHICQLNSTNKVGSIIHQFLKMVFNEPDFKNSVYKQIRYQILPVLWENHKAVECKKQNKLNFLAEVLDEAGRHTEAHVLELLLNPTYVILT